MTLAISAGAHEPARRPDALPEADLDAFRATGDPPVDALVAEVLSHAGGGRSGYNMMLDLADEVVAAPELALAESRLRTRLEEMPPSLREYFSPAPAPNWVDADKLTLGARLWSEQTLACLGVLYAASLPACYLIKNGIPALYDTAKLRESRYIFQRIHETGLMLDAVMSPGGLRVLTEAPAATREGLESALNAVDPGGGWVKHEHGLKRRDGAPEAHHAVVEQVTAAHAAQGQRYLFGAGYIAARKVRFLHASMRHMLNPMSCFAGAAPDDPGARLCDHLADKEWDMRLGAPVNQEDLAFTLLTFGYLIPKGLAHWGVQVTDEARDAFLHTWRVVGHLMGIDDALLTDDVEDARHLYARLKQRQGGHSETGVAMTGALLDFLADYLPDQLQLGRRIGASLIVDQLGVDDARDILEPAMFDSVREPYWRIGYAAARTGVRLFYWTRSRVIARIPVLNRMLSTLLHRVGEELIESWRGAFARRAFYVPKDADTWKLRRGVTEAFLGRLRNWRRQVFNTVVTGVGLVAGGTVAVALAAGAWFFMPNAVVFALAGAGLVAALAGGFTIEGRLNRVFDARPKLADEPIVAASHGEVRVSGNTHERAA